MTTPGFDGISPGFLWEESRESQVWRCRTTGGEDRFLLRIKEDHMARSLIRGLSPQIPARCREGAWELLLPWEQGIAFSQWKKEMHTLKTRREACLSLLAFAFSLREAGTLLALSAREENLCFSSGCRLRLLPDLSRWEKDLGPEETVRAIARLVSRVLTKGLKKRERQNMPPQLRLLLLRCGQGEYGDWGRLQQDVAVIPPDFAEKTGAFRRWMEWFRPWRAWAAGAAAAVLAALALLSLAGQVWDLARERARLWPGMEQVGDQILGKKGETP